MVEVFVTNVDEVDTANQILEKIHNAFTLYVATFDLSDCDRVLRVRSLLGEVDADAVITFVRHAGFHAAVMPDQISSNVLQW